MSTLTREAATTRVQAWLEQQDPAELVISDWVTTEIASALLVKMRMNQLSLQGRAKAAGLFTRLKEESLTTVSAGR